MKLFFQMENPWNIQSIYELQFFNCPASCDFKNFSKQEFINHIHLSHFGAVPYLMNIKDGSLDDINCPWNHKVTDEFKTIFVSNKLAETEDIDLKENILEIHDDNFDIKEEDEYIDGVGNDSLLNQDSSYDDIIHEDNCDSSIIDSENVVHEEKNVKTEKKYKCKKCEKSYNRSNALKTHVLGVHEGVKPFKCESCDASFANKSRYTKHLRDVHSNIKDNLCHKCDYKTSDRGNLKKHIKFVHKEGNEKKISSFESS